MRQIIQPCTILTKGCEPRCDDRGCSSGLTHACCTADAMEAERPVRLHPKYLLHIEILEDVGLLQIHKQAAVDK